MKRIVTDRQLHAQLTKNQRATFKERMHEFFDSEIQQIFSINGELTYSFEWFMALPDEQSRKSAFLRVSATYIRNGETAVEVIDEVAMFDSGIELSFYKALSELENEITDSNRVLFN